MLRGYKMSRDAAFNEIYKRYNQNLMIYCRSIAFTKEEAEEIFQEAWIKFLRQVDDGSNYETIEFQLYRISKGIFLDKYRKKKQIEFNVDESFDLSSLKDTLDLEENFSNNELINYILQALNEVSLPDREYFYLYWFTGMKHTEIAKFYEVDASNVRVKIHRVLDKINKLLAPVILELNAKQEKKK